MLHNIIIQLHLKKEDINIGLSLKEGGLHLKKKKEISSVACVFVVNFDNLYFLEVHHAIQNYGGTIPLFSNPRLDTVTW